MTVVPMGVTQADAQAHADRRQLTVATLAAALIQVRGDTSRSGIARAIRDATHSMFPDPSNSRFKAWRASPDPHASSAISDVDDGANETPDAE